MKRNKGQWSKTEDIQNTPVSYSNTGETQKACTRELLLHLTTIRHCLHFFLRLHCSKNRCTSFTQCHCRHVNLTGLLLAVLGFFPLLFLLVVLVKYETSDADIICTCTYLCIVHLLLFVYSSLLLNKLCAQLWCSVESQSPAQPVCSLHSVLYACSK